jgi:hypothetical protein
LPRAGHHRGDRRRQPKGLRLAGLVLASKAARDIPPSKLARGGKQ